MKKQGLNGFKKETPAPTPTPQPEPQPTPTPTPKPEPTPKKTIDELAREVIAGKWGNGADRVKRLTAAGYDYDAVQKRVNEILAAEKAKKNEIKKGDKVKVLKAITYTGGTFKTWYSKYDVIEVSGDRVVIGIGRTVTAAVNKKNLQKV